MSLIDKTAVITDCADAYRQASGTDELIKVGELPNKIASLGGGSGGLSFVRILRERYNLSGEEYPYICVRIRSDGTLFLYIGTSIKADGSFASGKVTTAIYDFPEDASLEKIIASILPKSLGNSSSEIIYILSNYVDTYHANFPQPEGTTVKAWYQDIE